MTREESSGSKPRFPRDEWFFSSSTSSSARFIGAVGGLLLVLPFPLGTLVERAWGDLPAILVLAGLAAGALAGGVALLLRRYYVLAGLLAALAAGGVIAAVITAVMDW